MNLTTLDTSYNWNHTIFVSFCDRLILLGGFPGGSAVENPAANAGDMGLIPGSGRPPEAGNGNLLLLYLGLQESQT